MSDKKTYTGTPWTRDMAVELCRLVEGICPKFGCHVALTGGLLYKDGSRKDCDILLYRIRQIKEINLDGLWGALANHEFLLSGFGWCYKCEYKGHPVDVFMPEEQSGEYNAPGTVSNSNPLNETEPEF